MKKILQFILFLVLLPALALAQPAGGTTKVWDGAQTLDITAGGAAKVDGSATTQPVTGTVNAAQSGAWTVGQSGTWTVQPGNTANTTAWKVDGSAVTQPVSGSVTVTQGTAANLKVDLSGTGANGIALKVDGSAVTQPVSGTFWQATQPVSGTLTCNAGTGNFDVTPSSPAANDYLPVRLTDGSSFYSASGSGSVTQYTEDVASAGAESLMLAGAVRRDTAASSSGTDGDYSTLNTDSSGRLWVNASGAAVPASQSGTWNITNVSGTVSLPTGAATSANQTTANTSLFSIDGKLASAKTADFDTGAGTDTVQMVGMALPKSGGAVAGGTSTDPIRIDPTGSTTQPVSGTVSAAQSGTWTVQPGNTANTTAWKVDGSSVTQPVNVSQVGGSNVSTAATGVQKVGLVGNAGATVDSTAAAGTAPTNAVLVSGVYNSTPPAPTAGQAVARQLDQAGNEFFSLGNAKATLSAWTNATALNATQNLFTVGGPAAAMVQLTQTTTLSAGAVTFEVTWDGTNWTTISSDAVIDPKSATLATISLPYTVQASTNKPFLLLTKGAQGLRVKLSTQITGSGSVTPNYALINYPAVERTVLGAGSATIGALTANQSVNVAQVNGVTPLMGNGVTGTGSMRVTIASDTTANSNPYLVTQTIGTTGGWSVSSQTGLTNTKVAVKASAGKFGGYMFYNPNASVEYIQVFDVASGSVTLGTTTPTYVIPLPASSGANIEFNNGIPHATAITVAATTTATGSSAPGTALTGFFLFK